MKRGTLPKRNFRGVMSKKAGVERGGKVIRRSTIYFRPYNKNAQVNTCVLFWVGERTTRVLGVKLLYRFRQTAPTYIGQHLNNRKIGLDFSYIPVKKSSSSDGSTSLRRDVEQSFHGRYFASDEQCQRHDWIQMSSYRKKKNRCRVDENHSRNAQSVSTTNQSATKQYLVRQNLGGKRRR